LTSKLRNIIALYMAKFVMFGLKLFKRNGTSFPGKVALFIDNSFLDVVNEKCNRIILITGTNGKTTTNNLINHILKGNVILSNLKGANMINGLCSSYVKNTLDSYDYGIFEVDEGSLDHVGKYLEADYLIVTNFFRDQLDRYGEIERLIDEVYEDIKALPNCNLIINCDDPYVNQFKNKLDNSIVTFGLDVESNKILETNLLLNKCPICSNKIVYNKHTYGHLGDYCCEVCGFNNKQKDFMVKDVKELSNSQLITITDNNNNEYEINYPYIGLYNAYNVCGVFALTQELGLDSKNVINSIQNFSFSLGRMEDFNYKNRIIKVILTKNPIGLSQVTRIISHDTRKKSILHILNDNMADGRDVSWIWDANTLCTNDETINKYYCSGRRSEDIALKKKYDNVEINKIHIINDMYKAIDEAIEDDVEIVYVLPTYTAIFETRDYIDKVVNK